MLNVRIQYEYPQQAKLAVETLNEHYLDDLGCLLVKFDGPSKGKPRSKSLSASETSVEDSPKTRPEPVSSPVLHFSFDPVLLCSARELLALFSGFGEIRKTLVMRKILKGMVEFVSESDAQRAHQFFSAARLPFIDVEFAMRRELSRPLRNTKHNDFFQVDPQLLGRQFFTRAPPSRKLRIAIPWGVSARDVAKEVQKLACFDFLREEVQLDGSSFAIVHFSELLLAMKVLMHLKTNGVLGKPIDISFFQEANPPREILHPFKINT